MTAFALYFDDPPVDFQQQVMARFPVLPGARTAHVGQKRYTFITSMMTPIPNSNRESGVVFIYMMPREARAFQAGSSLRVCPTTGDR